VVETGTWRQRGAYLAPALWAAVAWLSLGSPGCATRAPETASWERTELELLLPPPPEVARIGYLGEVRSEGDLGRRNGWLGNLLDWVAGKKKMSLVKPLSVARNRAGLLAVADPGLRTVHFFDLVRREYHWLDEEESSLLGVPVGVTLDDRGNAYVTDSIKRKVFVFDATRQLIREIGEGVLVRPTGIALDPLQEHLYVVDTIAGEVFTFDLNGELLGRFGSPGSGPGQFNSPTFVAVAPDGTLAISDTLNFRVQTFRPDGTLLNSLGQVGDSAGDLARPKGVAYDSQGRLYVVDGAFDNVQIFDPKGRLLLAFGGSGRGPGKFNLPVGLFIDSTHTLWVADSYNGRVQMFRLLEGEGP
jgi:sugar lactone lactonase YvrE